MSMLALMAFSAFASEELPRAEYPRPQFERADWMNLNGEWTCELDLVETGWERNLQSSTGLPDKITVPFAPESELSGMAHKDFIPCIWYQRWIDIPADWSGRDIMLNFGAVYYESEVYIDGKFVNRHFGGSDSYAVDITKFVTPGRRHSLVVSAKSDLRGRMQSAGKQSLQHGPFECMYTRTTGIWQTVWMEPVARTAIERVDIVPDIDLNQVSMRLKMRKDSRDVALSVSIKDGDKTVSRLTSPVVSGSIVTLPVKKPKLWTPETPHLYDVELTLTDAAGNVVDKVSSYFGMRKIHTEGNLFYLNNEPYYQRLVLDQGFYPQSNWTAPSDDALRRDIELGKQAGFNGARLHQKVFDERYYYWADRLGYLTWGESPSWGLDANDPVAARNFLSEWSNLVQRDVNHPSLVVWTPFNEQFWPDRTQYPRFIADVYKLTKKIDPSRPVNTVSGGVHIVTDIWTSHTYEQDPVALHRQVLNEGNMFVKNPDAVLERTRGNVGYNRPVLTSPYTFPQYDGTVPYIIDEFGGIKCIEANPTKDWSWGYGDAARTKEDFYQRLDSQVAALVSLGEKMWGYCYTQLTDVEAEQNGIYYYDRTPKYDMERIHAIFTKSIDSAQKQFETLKPTQND